MEKIYKKLNSVGISSMALGIITAAVGVSAGVLMIINGAKLLKSKKDIIF